VLFCGVDHDDVPRVEPKLATLTVDDDAGTTESIEDLDTVVFVPMGAGTLTERHPIDPYGEFVHRSE
jgi:hypothetical protein